MATNVPEFEQKLQFFTWLENQVTRSLPLKYKFSSRRNHITKYLPTQMLRTTIVSYNLQGYNTNFTVLYNLPPW